MNLVTPDKVLQGIAEARQGRTFCLGLPLDVPGGQTMNPRRIAPRRYAVTRDGKRAGQQGFCRSYASEDPDLTDVVNDDVMLTSLQYSTQRDRRAPVGSRFDADGDGVDAAVFYNGFRAGVEVRAGVEDTAAREPPARHPEPAATALGSLIADNAAVEPVMPKVLHRQPLRQPRLPLHEHCLFENGIHLGELWHLTELAAWLRSAQRHRLLLTAPPLRLPAAVGSPATPIATV